MNGCQILIEASGGIGLLGVDRLLADELQSCELTEDSRFRSWNQPLSSTEHIKNIPFLTSSQQVF